MRSNPEKLKSRRRAAILNIAARPLALLGKILFHRVGVIGGLLLLQINFYIIAFVRFRSSPYYDQFNWILVALSWLVIIWIVSGKSDPGYKTGWVIIVMLLMPFGVVAYLLLGGNRLSKYNQRRLWMAGLKIYECLGAFCNRSAALSGLAGEDAGRIAQYLEEAASCPVYGNTATTYYPLGEDCLQDMLDAFRNAERYIFLEYFIIEEGIFWSAILDVLKEKAAQGIEVRVLYDDAGTAFRLPWNYPARLERMGIHCRVFNRMVPVLSLRQNNRDHRKYAIVDGEIAFTGGINLADEYINVNARFGHWKDSVIRLEGDAVWSMTVSFLAMWDFTKDKGWDFTRYQPLQSHRYEPGYVQPYHDCPWDEEPVGQVVYLNLIFRAKRYVYITTPYLVLDHALNMALMSAAKSGVDVRIITPHIPDKKWVFEVTRTYYQELLEAGVQIFEYEPGFIHGKNMVVDDFFATVGTVNLDYRSMFLHFENGVVLYGTPAVERVRDDFLDTQTKSLMVTLADFRDVPVTRRLLRKILRLFAPLL